MISMSASRLAASASALPVLIDSVGCDHFGLELLSYLRPNCGADYAAVYRFERGCLNQVARGNWAGMENPNQQLSSYLKDGYWRKDPSIDDARHRLTGHEAATAFRVGMDSLQDQDFRWTIYPGVGDRMMVCGHRGDSIILLSLLREKERGGFSDEELIWVKATADLLVSLMSKHIDVMLRKATFSSALSSWTVIERVLMQNTRLARREAEICSRMLNGISAAGTAVDLGIAEESVKTYRKRAYQRLGIGSKQELLSMYLRFSAEAESDAPERLPLH
jgi:DNA-binding CsgD family transcriptional regulator